MPVKIFFCYAHKDETLLKELKTHLSPLWREGLIDVWYDRDISAGTKWEQQIKEQLNSAQIILLLISPDFMASDYVNNVELKRALERDERGEARVIPVILRHAYWKISTLQNLQALPTDAKPIKSWPDLDEAFYNVTEGIRKVVMQLSAYPASASPAVSEDRESKMTTSRILTPTVQQGVSESPFLAPLAFEKMILLRTLHGHESWVESVAISNDKQFVVSGSGDNTIKVWNLSTGQEVRTLTGHKDHVQSVSISPDGQTLVSGSLDNTIKVWNLSTGQEVRTLTGHKRGVWSTAISPDGQTLITGSGDTTINLWNLKTGDLVRTLTGHRSTVFSVAISADGQTLASGSGDNTIKVWNLSTGQEVRTLTGNNFGDKHVAISADGHILVGCDSLAVKVWNLTTGKQVSTITGNKFRSHCVAISADGQTLVGGGNDMDEKTYDGTIRVWDLSTGQEVRTLKGHNRMVNSLAISADGQILVSGSFDQTIIVWGM